jgi:hypothetical protein
VPIVKPYDTNTTAVIDALIIMVNSFLSVSNRSNPPILTNQKNVMNAGMINPVMTVTIIVLMNAFIFVFFSGRSRSPFHS